jgi:hypothetical protein
MPTKNLISGSVNKTSIVGLFKDKTQIKTEIISPVAEDWNCEVGIILHQVINESNNHEKFIKSSS